MKTNQITADSATQGSVRRGSLIILLILLVLGMHGCGFTAYENWAAYDIKVQVRGDNGEPIPDALVKTTDNQLVRTNSKGIADLFYTTGGLHVITVSADDWETTQTKVVVPLQTETEIQIHLVRADANSPIITESDSQSGPDARSAPGRNEPQFATGQ
jgi:hypothetical protein